MEYTAVNRYYSEVSAATSKYSPDVPLNYSPDVPLTLEGFETAHSDGYYYSGSMTLRLVSRHFLAKISHLLIIYCRVHY